MWVAMATRVRSGSEQGRPWGPGGVRPGRAEDADRSAGGWATGDQGAATPGVDGSVQRPARVRFVDERGVDDAADAGDDVVAIPVRGDVLDGAVAGDEVRLVDARGRHRSWDVVAVGDGSVEAVCDRTAYFISDAELER